MAGNSDELFAILQQGGAVVVRDPPKLDLDSYIQNYTGRTRFERLEFIGSHSVTLSVEALKAAVVEAKKGRDTDRYKLAQAKLAAVAPGENEAVYDKAWVDNLLKQNKAETDRLEAELKGYKNNLIKESIRGHEDLGSFFQSIGELSKAAEAFARMRQDVSINKHIIDVARHLVAVSIEQRNWIAVLSNVQKIQVMTQSPEEEKAIKPYLSVSTGLAHLAAKKYKDAAKAFLSVDAGMGNTQSDTASPNDVAIYGGLCALASMDRTELQEKVLESSSFRTYLELEPHIRRAISFFVNGRYSACLSILEGYRNDYLLDIHLHEHVFEIYYRIRSKSIVQYFIPFSCVTLDSLQEAFGIPGGEHIEKELIRMIKLGTLQARVDLINNTLVSLPHTPRATLQQQTLDAAQNYNRELRRRILRMNIINADLEVRGPPKKGGPGGPTGALMDDLVFSPSPTASPVPAGAGVGRSVPKSGAFGTLADEGPGADASGGGNDSGYE